MSQRRPIGPASKICWFNCRKSHFRRSCDWRSRQSRSIGAGESLGRSRPYSPRRGKAEISQAVDAAAEGDGYGAANGDEVGGWGGETAARDRAILRAIVSAIAIILILEDCLLIQVDCGKTLNSSGFSLIDLILCQGVWEDFWREKIPEALEIGLKHCYLLWIQSRIKRLGDLMY